MYVFGQNDENSSCSLTEQHVVLEIQLDHNGNETGYKLICDDKTIWDKPVGSLSSKSSGWQIEQSCIRKSASICNFTIFDSGEDGFSNNGVNGGGFFTLLLDATTVAYSEYGKVAPFAQQSFCFGLDCTTTPIEQKDDDSLYSADSSGTWVTSVNVTNIQPSLNHTFVKDLNVTDSDDDDSKDLNVNKDNKWTANDTHVTPEDNDMDDINDKPSHSNDGNSNYNSTKSIDNDSTMSESSSSSSSIPIFVMIVVLILVGVVIVVIACKKLQQQKTNATAIDAALSMDNTTSAVVSSNNDVKTKDKTPNQNDDHHNVQPAETFVTYDSSSCCDNTITTVVQTV